MATRAQKVRLSIFLAGSGGLLLLLLLLLAGNRLFSRRDSYEIEFRHTSVSGLETGAPVKYHGVQVGRVVALRVTDPTSVFISIQVKHGTPIMRDTRAVLTLLGITGLKFIELTGGTEDSGLLDEGGTILAGQSVFDAISGRAGDVMVKVELMLNSLNRLLSPETTDAVERTVVSLAAAAEQAEILLSGGRVPAGAARIDTILTRFASVSQNLDETMRDGELRPEAWLNSSNPLAFHALFRIPDPRRSPERSPGRGCRLIRLQSEQILRFGRAGGAFKHPIG